MSKGRSFHRKMTNNRWFHLRRDARRPGLRGWGRRLLVLFVCVLEVFLRNRVLLFSLLFVISNVPGEPSLFMHESTVESRASLLFCQS